MSTESEMEHILDNFEDAFTPAGPDPRARSTGVGTAAYVAVHPDGNLESRRGNFFEIKNYLRQAQQDVYQYGDGMGNDPLEDLPGAHVYWVSTYERGLLPDNPVANQLIRIFDGGQLPGQCGGIVVFSPEQYPSGPAGALSNHRTDLLVKVHTEVRRDLARGRRPRTRLWPSELITALHDVAPDRAWRSFEHIKEHLPPDTTVTEQIRRQAGAGQEYDGYRD